MTKWWGAARSALLLAALLPAACMKTVYLDHPDNGGGGGGVNGFDAGPAGGGNGAADGGGNSDAGHLHCSGSASAMQIGILQEEPAFMFVLDRSKSMLAALGNNIGATRFSVTRDAINVAVSSSPYSALVPFGYVEFPTADSSCSDVCCAAGFPSSTGQPNHFSQWLNQCSMSTQSLICDSSSDGVPTQQALTKVASFFKRMSNTLYALLLTDAEPSNDCVMDTSPSAGDACEQTTVFLNEMSTGNTPNGPTAPITTIVMAIGGVELTAPHSSTPPTYNGCLNNMAFAGGHPALNSPTAYTLASTEASVHTQIDTIVTNAICTFDIIDSSFDPNGRFEIDYNGSAMIASDPVNGWTVDKTKLTFNGSLCTTLITAMKNSTKHSVAVRECVDPSHPFQQPNP